MKPAVFVFVMLTALDGSPVWVESTPGVVPLIRQAREAHCGGGAGILVGGVRLCVKETPDQVRQKFEDANANQR